jgi:hypothetical protein
MNEEILKLLGIDGSIFEKSVTIVFDILIEMYEKRGLAYVESNRDKNDLSLRYANISIEILKHACLFDVTKTMLELSYIKLVTENTPTTDQLYELTIIKHLLPYIQQGDIEYIIDFQNYFCSRETIDRNCGNLSKYIDINSLPEIRIVL